jgi:hypothetical protein
MPLVEPRGGRAIEADHFDVGMCAEECPKIVRDGIFGNRGIETPRARRGGQYVPQRDVVLDQHRDAARIVGWQVRDPSRNDLPKGVLRIREVLPTLKRYGSDPTSCPAVELARDAIKHLAPPFRGYASGRLPGLHEKGGSVPFDVGCTNEFRALSTRKSGNCGTA